MLRLDNKLVKECKGVTLTSLVIYIVCFVIIIGIMANISNYFYENIGKIKESPKYVSELNKFSMFFISDVKRNTEITKISESYIEFPDGTKYEYKNNSIYRNDEKIAKYVESFKFEKEFYTVNSFSKTIIKVNTTFGIGENKLTKNIDFVLRYW